MIMRLRHFGFAFAAVASAAFSAPVGSAFAQSVPEAFWGAPRVDQDQNGALLGVEEQKLFLLWTGFYYGKIDRDRSDDFLKALKRFQASLGEPETAHLTDAQARMLRRRAHLAEKKADFESVDNAWTGIRVDLPMGYLSEGELKVDDAEKSFPHVYYRSRGSSDLSVDLVRYEDFDFRTRDLLNYLVETFSKEEGVKVLGSDISGNFIKVITLASGNIGIRVYEKRNAEYRGMIIRYPQDSGNIFAPVQMKILQSARFFAGAGLSARQRMERVAAGDYPGRADYPDWMKTMQSSGSGSVVSYKGHILTNFHVVQGCGKLTVNSNPAYLMAVDIVNDLALLRSDAYADRDVVRFRREPAQLGEEVLVMGYPLFSNSRALNLTTGVVSAQVGLQGDRRNIQITAPVQPGNSGGPVLDRDGRQVAVVVAKASSRYSIEANAENIAWVIRDDVAKRFLVENEVTPVEEDRPVSARKKLVEVVSNARRYTVRIECHKE